MLARLLGSVYATLLFALLAVATTCAPSTTTLTVSAPAATVTIPANQCNTGTIQCCNQVVTAGSGLGGIILGLLNIVVTDLDILLGVKCNPLSVIGIGGNTCEAHPVCCENNAVGGLISIGCIPINIIL
ncbi:hypothetical protein QCA50_005471 [Cerrena zonata]|uniref:Hydrophobin n=1 Tax=Cerrena zonata TaxID=2478898 RepID=A0AAW0GH09_9APHY